MYFKMFLEKQGLKKRLSVKVRNKLSSPETSLSGCPVLAVHAPKIKIKVKEEEKRRKLLEILNTKKQANE